METKIVLITHINPQQLQVLVNFIDGNDVVLERSYVLPNNQSIEILYPQIKEDLNGLERSKKMISDLGATLNQPVDLTSVVSSSELQAKQEERSSAQEKTSAEASKEDVAVEPTPPIDDATPLG